MASPMTTTEGGEEEDLQHPVSVGTVKNMNADAHRSWEAKPAADEEAPEEKDEETWKEYYEKLLHHHHQLIKEQKTLAENLFEKLLEKEKKIQKLTEDKADQVQKYAALFYAAKKRKEFCDEISKRNKTLKKELAEANVSIRKYERELKHVEITRARCTGLEKETKILTEVVVYEQIVLARVVVARSIIRNHACIHV
mmetsp:Transcript_40313/g.64769  ORF Transcript_40313/g.64769 Transcript_40313/m.64769 type:complete len:197 (+) Transcript_40313:158-748(+)